MRAVGPFSGTALDLSAGHEGLHLIYGPNEAGKTSALRAISHLLFGFPHLSSDNFVHPNDQLRVGGTLRHSNGEELEILRRRGRSNTLRAADDSSVVSDQWQRRFQRQALPRDHQASSWHSRKDPADRKSTRLNSSHRR